MAALRQVYLTRAKVSAYQEQLKYMEGEGTAKLSELLASSPGSGMGRPLDLPIHELARRFYAEINEIKVKLSQATIIEDYVKNLSDRSVINIGAKVTLTNLDTGDSFTYTILGPDEAEPDTGRISYLSPVGAALIGKRKGETVWVTSTGDKFRIDHFEYGSLSFQHKLTDWRHLLESTMT